MLGTVRPLATPSFNLRRCIRLRSAVPRAQARLSFLSACDEATKQLAAYLAQDLRSGDCYCLFGDVGAGKSAFSRAFIREACGDPYLPVPSPTFLLQNIYDDLQGPPIHHFDLYRLPGAEGTARLDLGSSFRHAVSLIEWADRLQGSAGSGGGSGTGGDGSNSTGSSSSSSSTGGGRGASGARQQQQQHLPGSRLEVFIAILDEESQARASTTFEERLRLAGVGGGGCGVLVSGGSQSEAADAVGRQQDSSPAVQGDTASPLAAVPPASTEGDDRLAQYLSAAGGDDDGDEEHGGAYGYDDVRWRRIELVPYGECWGQRLAAVREAVSGEEALRAGLLVMDEC